MVGVLQICRATIEARARKVTPVVYVVAAVLIMPVVVLLVAVIRGRAEVRSCCAADPARDLRMREAFTQE
jgi:hypothetical protein